MTTTTLNVQERKEFLKKYAPLTNLQKELFKLLQWSFIHQPAVFGCHKYFAKKLGCTREYVCRMMKKFLIYKWITWVSRGKWRSNQYTMSPTLAILEVDKVKMFTKGSITPSITPNYLNTKKQTSEGKNGGFYQDINSKKMASKEKMIKIPERIDRLNLPYDIKLKLSMVPEAIFQSALDSAKWKKDNGWQIKDPNKYVAGSALKMAKDQGMSLNWPAYYESMKNYQEGGTYGS